MPFLTLPYFVAWVTLCSSSFRETAPLLFPYNLSVYPKVPGQAQDQVIPFYSIPGREWSPKQRCLDFLLTQMSAEKWIVMVLVHSVSVMPR